jgi:hypothetical protein
MLDRPLPLQAVQYLNQILGQGAVRLQASLRTAELPYFVQDAYDIVAGSVHGHPITLACLKHAIPVSVEQIERSTQRIRDVFQTPLIVALPGLSPGERKQLIQRDIAFVVPGKQLFAPMLGMVLSEQFGTPTLQRQAKHLSPSTQALLIWFLLHHPVDEVWHPFDDAAAMGYAAMTATRAIRELVAFELFDLLQQGRAKYLQLKGSRRALWDLAKPFLRSPVQKTLWTFDKGILDLPGAVVAGEDALARLTLLNEPGQRVVAVASSALALAGQRGVFFEPKEVADGVAVQVWRYEPAMQIKAHVVDPLSLWVSLQGSADDRIQMALDELEEQFPW